MEFLALKWAVTNHFHEYLYGGRFEVYTDNNPLTYILTTAKLDATAQRWVARLGNYNFSLHYRSGKSNIDADALSRIPWTKRYEVFDKAIDETAMKAIICVGMVINHSNTAVEFSFILHHDHDENCDIHIMVGYTTPKKMANEEWVNEQMAGLVIGEVCKHLLDKTLHQRRSKRGDSDALKKLLKH